MRTTRFKRIRIITLAITAVLFGGGLVQISGGGGYFDDVLGSTGFVGQLLRATGGVARAGNAPANVDDAVLATETWDGNGTNNSWTTNDNWAGIGGAGAGDDLHFPGGASRRTNDNDFPVNTSFNSIVFDQGAGCAPNNCNYVITGNQIFLVSGILSNVNGSAGPIFNPNIILAANQFFQNQTNASAPLTINGVVNLNGHILGISPDGSDGTGSIVMNGLINGTGTLKKNGAGTAIIGGNSPGFGTTIIELRGSVPAGTLQVDGTLGNVQLSTGKLSGTGTVGAIDASLPSGPNNGVVSPGVGSGAGLLTASGSTQFAATSTFAVDLNGPTFPGQYDRLNVTGGSSIQLNGANLDVSLGFTPTPGQQFTIMQIVGAGSRTGQFAQGTSITVNGQSFAITYNSQSVVLTAQAAVPEMDVRGNGNSIADGDSTPSVTDLTDFGSTTTTVTRTFSILNTGNAPLNLTGSPKVVVGGTNAADFAVTVQPVSPVAVTGGTTTFRVVFDPGSTGLRTATLSIANNDSNENPYNFSIQGTGAVLTCPPPSPIIGNLGQGGTNYPSSSGVQIGRLSQNGVDSSCAAPKPTPGVAGAGQPFAYDAYEFANGAASCVTFTFPTSCGVNQAIHPVAYLGSYDPNNPAANYLGDIGHSINSSEQGSFSVNVPANSTVILVIHKTGTSDGCPNYSFNVSGLSCPVPNAAPIANPDNYATGMNTQLTIPAPGVIANDPFGDGPAQQAVLVTGPAHGSLLFNSSGSFQFTPTTSFVGSDSFTYRVNDTAPANNLSNVATVTIKIGNKTAFDFDGDGKTDISIFRPAPGEWWYQKSSNNQVAAAQFGQSTDKITPGDFTGDGKTDIAFWRPSDGFWYVLRSEDFSFFAFPFGTNGDVPAPADYDGDGKSDAAVFRPSAATWFILRSADGGTTIAQFGAAGDASAVADYDGDGKADIAIWRPSVGEWWIQRSSNNTVFATQFGASTDKAVQGDYTGDGKADIAFWRPSTGFWFILRSEDFSFFSFPFGTTGDVVAPGDYDGDGKFDAGVFRPSNATWFVQRTTAGTLIQQFGAAGDIPVPAAFVP